MTWLVYAVLAQLASALTVFIDKYVLVTKDGGIKHPAAYAFYTALLSGVVLVLLPFGLVTVPSYEVLFLSLISALCYITSLLFLYRTLQELTVTDVIPITAASGAVATGLLASIFLTGDLPLSHIPAFVLLTAGTFMIYCFCFPGRLVFMALMSGGLVGVSTFVVKLAFDHADSFANALFWPLIMNVVVALLVLAPARFFAIREGYADSSARTKWLVVVSKALGGLSFALTFLAIAGGSVSVVNALGGLQLVFLLILVPLFAHQLPHVFKYELTRQTIILKILGTLLIVIGLALLFIL